MTLRPCSPSFLSCSRVDDTVVISWRMMDAAAREHVEHAENAAGLAAEDLVPGGGIDARQRNVGSQAIDEQRAEREPDAFLEFLGLGERRKIQVGRQLFRCRDHASAFLLRRALRTGSRAARPI